MNHLEAVQKAIKAAELHGHIEEFLDKEYGQGFRTVFQTACKTISDQFEEFNQAPINPLFELTLTSICLRDREELMDVDDVMIINKYTEGIENGGILENEEGVEEIAHLIHKMIYNIGKRDLNFLTEGKSTSLHEAQEMAATYLENL